VPLARVAGPDRLVVHANRAFVEAAGPVAPGTPLAVAVPPDAATVEARWTTVLPAGTFRVRIGERDGVTVAALEREPSRDLEDRLAHADRLATFGRLAAGVVHDLRGPLTAIQVSAEALLSRYALDPAAAAERDKARRIVENGERILGFVQNLLAYARPSPEGVEPIDGEALVQGALVLCAHVAEDRGATLTGTAEPGLAVVGSRLHLEQILVNLVGNACQAVGRGGQVQVSARAEGRDVILEVRDDGAGIAPEHLERIFEPFFTTRAAGTGLGLSIVRGIVEKHGGTVGVESAVGKGTRFSVRLPGRYARSSTA
jgi:signal transduction histidine kinase